MRFSNKKQRGQRRRFQALAERIHSIRDSAFADSSCSYECFPVPSSPFIQARKTDGKIKTAFCREWIRETEKIIERKPKALDFCKVVCMLSLPNLWKSQIIIFYSKEYYDSFVFRANGEQVWTLCDEDSLCAARNIATNLPECLYRETIFDENEAFHSDLWFYGDIWNIQ